MKGLIDNCRGGAAGISIAEMLSRLGYKIAILEKNKSWQVKQSIS